MFFLCCSESESFLNPKLKNSNLRINPIKSRKWGQISSSWFIFIWDALKKLNFFLPSHFSTSLVWNCLDKRKSYKQYFVFIHVKSFLQFCNRNEKSSFLCHNFFKRWKSNQDIWLLCTFHRIWKNIFFQTGIPICILISFFFILQVSH